MSKKDENYPVFSEVKVSEIPESAIIREQPSTNLMAANVMAVAAFVIAILSIFPCLIAFSAPISVIGVILAIAALCKKTRKKGLAISGLIINIITLAGSVMFMIFSTTVFKSLWITASEYIQNIAK